jgi:hypothetical protein
MVSASVGKFCFALSFAAMVIVGTSGCISVRSKDSLNGFEAASNTGEIGEIGSLYVRPKGVNLNPMNNDYVGKTDKLLTGSSNIGLHSYWSSHADYANAVAANVYWRALTPSFRPNDDAAAFEEPVGVFADWLEFKLAFASTKKFFLGGLKVQTGFGYGNINDRGIKVVHRRIHRQINQPTSNLTYKDQPIGDTYSGDAMAAYILPTLKILGVKISVQGAVGGKSSLSMLEHFKAVNGVIAFSDGFKVAAERKIIRQVSSELYLNPRKYRYESSGSLLVSRHFQPQVKYVSPYLVEDHVGQIYVDLINFIWPF